MGMVVVRQITFLEPTTKIQNCKARHFCMYGYGMSFFDSGDVVFFAKILSNFCKIFKKQKMP